MFSTRCAHSNNWNIREFKPFSENDLTLQEALKRSNNNVFANAAFLVGIEKIQSHLANIFGHPVGHFLPASIFLGATITGISLYELASAYYGKFIKESNNTYTSECVQIMRNIAHEKLGRHLGGTFIKTGTTNGDKERYCMVGFGRMLFGFLRQDNEPDENSKEGTFLKSIMTFLERLKQSVQMGLERDECKYTLFPITSKQ